MTNISRPIPKNFPSYAEVIKYDVALSDMGDHYITATVHIAGNIIPDFSFTWEIEFRGNRYIHYIRQPQAYKDTTTQKAIYTLIFELDFIDDMKSQYFSSYESVNTDNFQGVVVSEYTASFVGSISMFADMLQENLSHYFSDKGYVVDLNPTLKNNTDQVIFSISDSYIWDVLQQVYDTYGYRWRLETNDDGYPTIMIGYESNAIDHTFKYGFDGGLMKLERSVDETNIYNVVRGRGSSENVPPYYFKTASGDNAENYASDPDAIDELENFYFDKIRSAQFRLYVKGWRAALYGDTLDTTMYADRDTYFAYCQGYDDGVDVGNNVEGAQFEPVEYIRDEDSIEMYGEKAGAIDDVEEAMPSIQGMDSNKLDIADEYKVGRVDEVVAVEEVLIDTDDSQPTSYSEEINPTVFNYDNSEYGSWSDNYYITTSSRLGLYPIPILKTINNATVEEMTVSFNVVISGYDWYANGEVNSWFDTRVRNAIYESAISLDITGVDASNITIEEDDETYPCLEKTYKISIVVPFSYFSTTSAIYLNAILGYTVKFNSVLYGYDNGLYRNRVKATISTNNVYVKYKTEDISLWKDTFDIWIKNIFQSTKSSSETDAEYVERMWNDVVLEDASVSFSSGALSSADYNFLIPKEWQKNIHYDTSKSISSVDGNTYQSHWRLTLAKSTEDERSNIAYVPYSMQNAKAGDYFYLVNIQLPHFYTTYAESVVDDYIRATLAKRAQVNPTWVLTSDPVAMATKSELVANLLLEDGGNFLLEDGGYLSLETQTAIDGVVLLEQLNIGTMITVQDHRFIEASEQLHVSTLNLTYSRDSILPSVTLSLTDEITPQISSSEMLSAEIEALSAKIGSAINAQDVMGIGDARYLMKTGQDQKTLSKTEFDTTISSTDARQGSIAGSGWLIYTDSKGKKVIETDILVARNEVQVNSLVINQISVQGGKEILCAAEIECTRVDDDDTGYICYFDQKQGSVGNLFQTGDVAYSTVFNVDNTTLKYYKRMVVATDVNSITLSKDDDFVNGSGIPAEGDVICHYGSYTDSDRRYVIVRDVIGGGNEQMIMDLYSVNTDGYRYYFAGVETGQNPVWQIGDSARGGMRVEVNGNGEADNKVEIWASSFSVQNPSGEYEDVSEQIAAARDTNLREAVFLRNDSTTQISAPTGINTDGSVPTGWYDEFASQAPTQTERYTWRSERKKTNNVWGAWGTPAIFSTWSIDGADGTSVTILSRTITYAVTTTSAQPADSQFTLTSIPTDIAQGSYLWTRTFVDYSSGQDTVSYTVSRQGVDGATGATGEKGDKGDTGERGLQGLQGADGADGIAGADGQDGQDGADGLTSYFHIAYADSATGSGFSQSPTGKDYIGTYVDFTSSDAGSTSSLWKWQLVKGADGADGSQGIAGTNGVDGVTYYLHIAYANSANGVTDFSTTDATGRSYIGTLTNTTLNDSTNPNDYTWSKSKGEDITITSKSITYNASTSGTVVPTDTWSSAIVTAGEGEYLWTRTIVNYSDGNSTTAYSVARQGINGADARYPISTDTLFKVTTTNVAPTYNIGDDEEQGWYTSLTNITANTYIWQVQVVAYNSGDPTASAVSKVPVVNGVDGTNGTNGQDGADGATGATGRSVTSVKEQYYLSTSKTTQTGGSWQDEQQTWEAGKYQWIRTYLEYSSAPLSTTTTPYIDSSWEAVDDVTLAVAAINSDAIFSIDEKLTTRTAWEKISGRADVDHTPSEAVTEDSRGSYSIAMRSALALGTSIKVETQEGITIESISKSDTGSSDNLYWGQDNNTFTSPTGLSDSEGYSYMRLSFNANMETEVNFGWVVSTEGSYDFLVIGAVDLDIPDEIIYNILGQYSGITENGEFFASGEDEGTETRIIPQGEHYVDIWYIKDGSSQSDSDQVSVTISYEENYEIETEVEVPIVDTTGLTEAYQGLLTMFSASNLNLYGAVNTDFTTTYSRTVYSNALRDYATAEEAVQSETTEANAAEGAIAPVEYLMEATNNGALYASGGLVLTNVFAVLGASADEVATMTDAEKTEAIRAFVSGIDGDGLAFGAHSSDAYSVAKAYIEWYEGGQSGTEPTRPNFAVSDSGRVFMNNAEVGGKVTTSYLNVGGAHITPFTFINLASEQVLSVQDGGFFRLQANQVGNSYVILPDPSSVTGYQVTLWFVGNTTCNIYIDSYDSSNLYGYLSGANYPKNVVTLCSVGGYDETWASTWVVLSGSANITLA